MTRKSWRKHKNSFWHRKEINRHTGCLVLKRFNKRGQLQAKKEVYDPEYEHWGMKVFDRKTGMVTWSRFDKDGKLEVKEFYDPLHELWPIKVVDKHTGMVTWKRFDKAFNWEEHTFYVPELHDSEAQPRRGWAFCSSAAASCCIHPQRSAARSNDGTRSSGNIDTCSTVQFAHGAVCG